MALGLSEQVQGGLDTFLLASCVSLSENGFLTCTGTEKKFYTPPSARVVHLTHSCLVNRLSL